MRLTDGDYREIDAGPAAHEAFLRERYPGERAGRQPVHTVYVPADRVTPDLIDVWRAAALAAMQGHEWRFGYAEQVEAKLRAEPIEDLRIDLEDGYGVRDDAQEDAAVKAAAAAL